MPGSMRKRERARQAAAESAFHAAAGLEFAALYPVVFHIGLAAARLYFDAAPATAEEAGADVAAVAAELDAITAHVTAARTFRELVEAEGNYRPTIRLDQGFTHEALADLYDAAQQHRGDGRRAYRGRARTTRDLEAGR